MPRRMRERVPTMESAIPQAPIYTHTPLDTRHRWARRGRNEDGASPGQPNIGKTMPDRENPIGELTPNHITDPSAPSICSVGTCTRCGRTLINAAGSRRTGFKMLCRPDCDGVWPKLTPLGIAIQKPQEKKRSDPNEAV